MRYPSVREARSQAALGFVLSSVAIALGVSCKYHRLAFSKNQCVINSPSGKKRLLVFIAGLTQNLSVSKLLWEMLVEREPVETVVTVPDSEEENFDKLHELITEVVRIEEPRG